jgi:lipopolysaccharide export LptBFGC system permease protein LptF
MRKNFYLLVFLCLSVFSYSQKFQSAVIEMKDGSKKTGWVQSKSLSNGKQIQFKADENAKAEPVSNTGISAIEFSTTNNKNYRLDYVSFYPTEKRNKTEATWMLKLVSGYYDLYTVADYSFDKAGNIVLSTNYLVGSTLPEFYYFVKKQGESNAQIFGLYSPSPNYFGLHKILKESVNKLMADDPALVKKVESKQLSTKNIEQIVKQYNEFKAKP